MPAVSEHLFLRSGLVRSGMVGTRGAQPLSYNLRLPDAAPADALPLLDASRALSNQALTTLWPRLDDFAAAHRSRLETGRRPPVSPGAPWTPAVALTRRRWSAAS